MQPKKSKSFSILKSSLILPLSTPGETATGVEAEAGPRRAPQLHRRQDGEVLEPAGGESAAGERRRLAQDHAGRQRPRERLQRTVGARRRQGVQVGVVMFK